jgi:hypothetical protein
VDVVALLAADVELVVEEDVEAGAMRLVACCRAEDMFGVLPELVAGVVFPPCLD